MRGTLIILLFGFFPFIAISQQKKDSMMDLSFLLRDDTSIMQFLDREFDDHVSDQIQMSKSNHPMSLLNYNRRLRNTLVDYSFFDYHVNDIYGYRKDKLSGGVYILLDSSDNLVPKMSKELGNPEGEITSEEDGDGIYIWGFGSLDVIVKSSRVSRNQIMICMLDNLKFNEVMSLEKIY